MYHFTRRNKQAIQRKMQTSARLPSLLAYLPCCVQVAAIKVNSERDNLRKLGKDLKISIRPVTMTTKMEVEEKKIQDDN